MKKFILIFTLLFLFPLKVYGLTDLGYMKNNEKYIVDKNDFKIEYGEWMPYNEEDIENIEVKREYTYSTINPLQYIQISNSKVTINIEEIEVYYNKEKINYGFNSQNCKPEQRKYLNDGILNDSNKIFELSYRTTITLNLKKEYSLENITLKIYLENPNYSLDVTFCEGLYKYDNTIKKNVNLDSRVNTIKIDDDWIFNTKYLNPIKTNEYINETWYRKVDVKSEYRTITKLFRHYKEDIKNNNQNTIDTHTLIKHNISNNKILQNVSTPKSYFKNNTSNISNNIIEDTKENISNTKESIPSNKKTKIKQTLNNYKIIKEKNIIKNVTKNKLILIIILLTLISILLIYINKNYRRC